MKGSELRIQCLLPVIVATKMTQYDAHEADGFFVVSPETYAKQAVDIIGNCPFATGCIAHELLVLQMHQIYA